jgi:hypothetical protein
VAIPVGLLIAAVLGTASAFVDLRPSYAPFVMRHRRLLRRSVVVAALLWFTWTVLRLPGLESPSSEGAAGSTLAVLAGVGFVLYVAAAVRYLVVFRDGMSLLPASVVACFVLLAEAMVGVATTGERSWHASWWEWHGLIVLAFLVVFYAARREWRDERFRTLYLSTTRERTQDVSVMFCDLAGYTSYTAAAGQSQAAQMLAEYYSVAAPLVSKQYGGEVEKSSATASSPPSTPAATSTTTRSGPPVRRWRCSASSARSRPATRGGHASGSGSTAVRRWCASWVGAGTSRTPSSATP